MTTKSSHLSCASFTKPRTGRAALGALAASLCLALVLLSSCAARSDPDPVDLPEPAVKQAAPDGGSAGPAADRFARVQIRVDGVASPRGCYNIYVRLYKIPDLMAYRFDLGSVLLTLDFMPGVRVTPELINSISIKAGYTPGPYTLRYLPISLARGELKQALERRREQADESAFTRWWKMNF
jgi:hypothetical protein